MSARQYGFSSIELLIVVLIIGILAAIALPTLNGARTKAKNVVAQATVRNAINAATSLFLFGGSGGASSLQGEENSLQIGDQTDPKYAQAGSDANPGAIFVFDADGNTPSSTSNGAIVCAASKGDTVYCARQTNQNGNLGGVQRYALKHGSAKASVGLAVNRLKINNQANFDNWSTPEAA